MIQYGKNVQPGLRLRSLALLLQGIAVIVISLTFMIATNNSLQRVQNIFNNSNTVIFETETNRQLGYSLQLYQVSISQAINSGNHSLISMQKLYTLIQNQYQYIQLESYPEYVSDENVQFNETQLQDQFNSAQFGYQSAKSLDTQEYSVKLSFRRVLNEYIFEFPFFEDNATVITFVDYGQEEFYFQYPIYSNQGEYLQNDPQLCDFKQSNQSNVFITPMFNYANGPIYLQLFSQLKNLSNFVEGSLRSSQSFALKKFPQLYSIIADQDWNIHTYYGLFNYTSQESIIPFPDYPEFIINASSLTGFNQHDWFQIMTSESSMIYSDLLGVNVYARREKFQNSEMILVVYQDVSDYLAQQDFLMRQLQTFGIFLEVLYYNNNLYFQLWVLFDFNHSEDIRTICKNNFDALK